MTGNGGSARAPRHPATPAPPADIRQTARSIAAAQRPDGAIPWPDGHVDPWDHVEDAVESIASRLGFGLAMERALDVALGS